MSEPAKASPTTRRRGRGAVVDPANRFERLAVTRDEQQLGHEDAETEPRVSTEFFEDHSKTLICENQSPDLPFRFSINPYRGCEHGCAYCYARPTHETLGFNAGIDFESKIMVKSNAALLLSSALADPSWSGEPITISGVTDCYQPAERYFRITRQILQVLLDAKQPFSIVTKNALVTRDLDLLTPAAELGIVHVFLSLTTQDAQLARRLEPRTSSPRARLRAISQLASAGVPVGTMVAPMIPGLNDHELPGLLKAAAAAGARAASYILLRLPWSVENVFDAWLKEYDSLRRERVWSRIRDCRGGKTNESRFGLRMKGEGVYAESIRQSFRTFQKKFGLDQGLPPLNTEQFHPPMAANGQQTLF